MVRSGNKISESEMNLPNLNEENALYSLGYNVIAGIDEAGRGSLAGPVVAAAVILPKNLDLAILKGARDSKLMTPGQREKMFKIISNEATAVAVGIISPEIIDTINILNATIRAMIIAVQKLKKQPEYLLVDGMMIPNIKMKQKGIIKGDRLCLSIACASIVAKVTRDHIMIDADGLFPGYGMAIHKGYGTRKHIECLSSKGPTKIHRLTFSPVRQSKRMI